jgi:hypothetical protein
VLSATVLIGNKMNIKFYKDINNNIFNYPLDGSQDSLIGDKTQITQEEADILVIENFKKQGIEITPTYVLQRSNEYPSVKNFLDAWVKNDEAALEEYRQACLAVKAKYPKPAGF